MTQGDAPCEESVRFPIEEDEANEDALPPPPDGGYGWVVVAASFMCNLTVDGIGYSFGVLLPELVDFFGQGKGTVAWVGSLLTGVNLTVGPLVSALCNKYGCRAVCIAGSLVATVGFVLSIFSQSATMMMLTYGFIGGLGSGMIYLPSVVAVGYYFETRRSLATGIAVCGSGVGTFSFAPLTNFLLSYFGTWQSSNLFLAGLLLNCSVYGALMRPLVYPKKPAGKKPLMQRMAEEKKLRMERDKSFIGGVSLHSAVHLDLVDKRHNKGDTDSMMASKISVSARREGRMVRPMSRKDIFYSGSIVNLPQYQSQKSLAGYRNSVLSLPDSRQAGDLERHGGAGQPKLIDTSLLRDAAFMLIAASSVLGFVGLYVPFVYIVDAAILSGVAPSQASFLLSIIGITNTFGRIMCGWVADFPWMDSLLLNNCCLVIGTIAIGVTPFCSSYAAFVAVAIAFGISVSGFISLTSIILVDLLGLDKLTNAFGLLILFRGVATMVGSPLGGAVFDYTKSYDATFFMASGFFLLATIASFTAPRFRKKEEVLYQPTALSPIDEDLEEGEEEGEDTPITMGTSLAMKKLQTS